MVTDEESLLLELRPKLIWWHVGVILESKLFYSLESENALHQRWAFSTFCV
jgi:hypothetical protein